MTDDEMEACAAQTGPHARSQHQSRTWDRKDFNGRSPSERRPAYTPKPTENASQTERTIVLLGVVVVNVTHFAMIPLGVPLGVMIIMKRKMVENDSRLRIQAAGHVMGRTSKDAVYSSNRPMQ